MKIGLVLALIMSTYFIALYGQDLEVTPVPQVTGPEIKVVPPVAQTPTTENPLQEITDDKTPTFLISAGIGQRTTSWNNWKKTWDNVTYEMNSHNHTIIEGDISAPKISTKIGFNIHQDSGEISKIRQFAGYLGFGQVSLKAEKGTFAGTAYYQGRVSTEQTANVSFDQEYTYTEIDFSLFDLNSKAGIKNDYTYLGLRYTKWLLPSEVLLTQESKAYSVIDSDFQAEFYSFIMGEDSFTSKLLYDPIAWQAGWDFMRSYVLGVGYGNCKVSDVAARAAQELNSVTMTKQEYPVMAGHISGMFGLMYGLSISNLRVVMGLGYDVNFLFLGKSPFASSGGGLSEHPANDSGKADVDTFPMFIYHGPILRVHGIF